MPGCGVLVWLAYELWDYGQAFNVLFPRFLSPAE